MLRGKMILASFVYSCDYYWLEFYCKQTQARDLNIRKHSSCFNFFITYRWNIYLSLQFSDSAEHKDSAGWVLIPSTCCNLLVKMTSCCCWMIDACLSCEDIQLISQYTHVQACLMVQSVHHTHTHTYTSPQCLYFLSFSISPRSCDTVRTRAQT